MRYLVKKDTRGRVMWKETTNSTWDTVRVTDDVVFSESDVLKGTDASPSRIFSVSRRWGSHPYSCLAIKNKDIEKLPEVETFPDAREVMILTAEKMQAFDWVADEDLTTLRATDNPELGIEKSQSALEVA